MSYKKYIKRGGKTFGPYVYHSKKIDGKVISEYQGKYEKKNNKKIWIFVLVGLILLLSFLLFINTSNSHIINFQFFNSAKESFLKSFSSSLTGFDTSNLNSSNDTIIPNETITPNETIPIINDTGNTTINENNSNITSENVTIEINQTNTSEINITEFNITNETIANETITNITEIANATISTIQLTPQITLNKPVKWKKQINPESTGNLTVIIPSEAKNIDVLKITDNIPENITSQSSITGATIGGQSNFFVELFNKIIGAITGRAVDKNSADNSSTTPGKEVQINIDEPNASYEVQYETPAPYAIEDEKSNGKTVTIVGSDTIHYTDVLAFTNLNESLGITDPSSVKIYWVENNTYIDPSSVQDTNSNGIYDYVEWNVPHLSNQTFDIIVVTKAEHLDSNRNFISDIYPQVKALDDIWSETINDSEYVRVTFEKQLTSSNDIKIYPRVVSGSPKIEVYENNGTDLIATFDTINSNEYNRILLTNLQNPQDTFDLKVVGGAVQFDYIVDPITSAFVDGTGVLLNSTSLFQTTVATLSTTFAAGTNIVIAAVQLNSTNAGGKNVTAGNLSLNRAGGVSLATNEFGLLLGVTNTTTSYVLIDVDKGAPANQAYNVTAHANASSIFGDAKIIAISRISNYYYNDSISKAISTTGAEIASMPTTFEPGDNIILASIQIDNGATGQNITSNSIRIGNSASILASNNLNISLGGSNNTARDRTIFLIAKDTGAAANTRYNVTILGPQAANAEVKAIVFQVPNSYFIDGVSQAISTTPTLFVNLTTSIGAGHEIVALGSSEFTTTATGVQYISPGNFSLNENGLIKSVNKPFLAPIAAWPSTTAVGGYTFTSNLLWRNASVTANPVYNLSAQAVTVGLNASGEILVLDFTDTILPKSDSNSTNGTTEGHLTLHSARWTDVGGLSGYIFSFDNGTGTLVNDSFVPMTGGVNWSNVTKGLNTTTGTTIRWQVYANDTSNNFNGTSIFSYVTTADNPPQWFTPLTNDSAAIPGDLIIHGVNWTDDFGLSYAILEINGTGAGCNTFSNVTTNSTFGGKTNWSNMTWTIPNACEGKPIGWRQYANDSQNQWNATDLQTYIIGSIAPVVSFGTNPIDNKNSSNSSITFDLKVSDNNAVDELKLYGNWTGNWAVNQTNSSPINDTFWNVTVIGIPDGKYIWAAWANDTSGNSSFTTTNRTLTIDTITPLIDYGTGVSANNSNVSRNYVFVNVSYTEANPVNITFRISNTTGIWNSTTYLTSNNTSNVTINWTGLADGIYDYNATIYDIVAHSNTTQLRRITLETISPQIQFVSPTENNGTSKNQNWVFANVSVIEANLANITFKLFNATGQLNSTTYTSFINQTNWTNLNNSNVMYWYNVSAYDTAGNLNQTETRYITLISNQAPVVNLFYPQNITYNTNVSQLNYTATDNVALSTCKYSLNNGITNTTITCGQNVTGLNSGEGSSTWKVYANDTSGNENSSTVTFFVDSINPAISLVSPTETNNSALARNYIQVNASASDANLNTITIRLFNSSGQMRINYSLTNPFFINYTGLSAGNYSFNATANDTANNQNSTETRNVSLVTPTLNITIPGNKTYITTQNLNLNFTASNYDNIAYNLDGGANTTITANTTFNTTNGAHTLYLFANNSIGTTVKNITFTANTTKFIVIYNNFSNQGSTTNFNSSSYEDLQNLSGIILEEPNYGKIKFNDAINVTNDSTPSDNRTDLDDNVVISSNFIYLNSTALPNFNKSANLFLYGLTFSNPRILRDGALCPVEICTQQSYSNGIFAFTVTQFSNYSAEETPASAVASTGPSGGGGGNIPQVECMDDSQCTGGKVCWENKCVQLFDVKIIDFSSPVKLGDFFGFTYYIKGQADINNDVAVSFWIQNQSGYKVTTGSDTIYMGTFDEKTETTKIFLPTTLESGVYDFYVEVNFNNYHADSHRTIQIEVKNGVATITNAGPNITLYLILGSILLVLILFFIVFLRRRTRISETPVVKKSVEIIKPVIKKEELTPVEKKVHEKRYILRKIFAKVKVAFLNVKYKFTLIRARYKARRLSKQKAKKITPKNIPQVQKIVPKKIAQIEPEIHEKGHLLYDLSEKVKVVLLRVKYWFTSLKPKYEAGVFKKNILKIESLPKKIFKPIKSEIKKINVRKSEQIQPKKESIKPKKEILEIRPKIKKVIVKKPEPIKLNKGPKKGPKTVAEIIEELREESEKEE